MIGNVLIAVGLSLATYLIGIALGKQCAEKNEKNKKLEELDDLQFYAVAREVRKEMQRRVKLMEENVPFNEFDKKE